MPPAPAVEFNAVLAHASSRYRPCGRTAYHFARGKLRGDPVYRAVRAGNWIKACWVVRCAQAFHFRPRTEWCRWLEQAGLDVEVHPMGMGTPFGNVLLVARRRG